MKNVLTGNALCAVITSVIAINSTPVLAAAGETIGILNLAKSNTLFSIGSSQAGGKMWTTGVVSTTHSRASSKQTTDAMIDLDGSLLNYTVKLLDAGASTAINHTSAGTNWKLGASVKVAGNTLLAPAWTQTGNVHSGDTGVKPYNMTFFTTPQVGLSFDVPIIGDVGVGFNGKLGGEINVRALAHKDAVNNSNYLQEFGKAFVYSGARIIGTGEGGINAVILKAFLQTNVDLINGWVNAETWADRIEYWNNPASTKVLYRGNLNSDASASIGSGNLKGFIDIGVDLSWLGGVKIYTVEQLFAEWKGYTIASKKLYQQFKEEYFAK